MPSTASLQRVLITVSGPDRPGITAALTGIIAEADLDIVDMEQVVVQDLLSLSIVLAFPPGDDRPQPVLKDLLFAAKELGVELDFTVLPRDEAAAAPARQRSVLTLIGQGRIRSPVIARMSRILADNGFNIETIQSLSHGQLHSLELVVSSPATGSIHALKDTLLPVGREYGVDLAVQPDTVLRRLKRLVVFDLDSTLIQAEVIDELAREAGVSDAVRAITARAMAGELDFREALTRRVAQLEGLPLAALERVYDRLPLTPGAEALVRTLKRLGFRTAIISGGFSFFTERIQRRLGLDYAYANRLEMAHGHLTGRVEGPILDGEGKAERMAAIAEAEHVSLDQVIAIGDGANDLPMLHRAGLGIAFNAKPSVRDAAEHSLNQHSLDAILFLLGITQADIAQIHAEAEVPHAGTGRV